MKRASKTIGIQNYFKTSNKGDPVQNYILEREKEETDEHDKVEADVHVDVDDVNFYKNKVSELEKENLKLKKDNTDLKKLFNKSNQVNLQKDLLIHQLRKQLNENNGQLKSDSLDESQTKKQKLLFEKFQNTIDSENLVKLRSISDRKEKDSTFVSQCLKILYESDVSVLTERTATKTTSNKEELTPEKKSIINQLFFERLSSINLSPKDEEERRSKLRIHLSNSIHNISSTKKKSDHPVANTSAASKP